MTRDPTASVVRHSFALRRYENTLARGVHGLFREAGDRLRDLLTRVDPNEVSAGWVRVRLALLDDRAADILRETYADLARFAGDRLVPLADLEAEFAARLLERTTGSVTIEAGTPRLGVAQWRSIVSTDPVQGAPLREWWRRQRAEAAFGFRRQVQLGMTNGETTPEIIRRVRGRFVRPGVYEGGVLQASTRQAETLVRTAVNQVASRAQLETYRANADVTTRYVYTATLDDRTSDICRALDGQEFAYGEGPVPPQHPNCRSAIRPVVDWKALGIDPPTPGQRASKDGPVSARLDYSGWLRQQSAAEQDEILGPARGKLFRAGKVTLKDLVRMDGSTLTLDELREAIAA